MSYLNSRADFKKHDYCIEQIDPLNKLRLKEVDFSACIKIIKLHNKLGRKCLVHVGTLRSVRACETRHPPSHFIIQGSRNRNTWVMVHNRFDRETY